MLVRKEFLFVMLFSAFLAGCNGGRQGATLAVDGSAMISVMDFKEPMTIDPLPAGWLHRKFFRTAPMDISIGMRDGHAAIRLETRASASMLYRFTDIDIVAYPNLNWDWMVERPIVSAIHERAGSAGDDHPARIYLKFRASDNTEHAMELIWGNVHVRAGE